MKETSIKALLIEDDPEDTMLLVDLLAGSGWPSFRFYLECAEDLESGLKALSRGGVEVVILDLFLPDCRGLETVDRVRAGAPGVPIVVLTGLQDEALGLEALARGAQDYQVKGSLEGHALKRTITYAVERHRMMGRLEGLIAKAADAMVVIGVKGLVRYANPAAEALFGRPASELIGKPFPHPVPAGRSGELRIKAADGGERVAEMRLTEIEWKDEAAGLASIRDITELRRLEQLKAEIVERRRMDKLKDELMSAVSHEMRTPLSVICASVHSLAEGLAGPLAAKQETLVGLARKSVERLQRIVDNVLDLSRLESGQAVLRRERVEPAALIREAVRGFRLTAGEERLVIQEDIAEGLPPVFADADLLSQVLNNLIDNAVRFAKTSIRVSARPVEEAAREDDGAGAVEFSVSDDGPGVASEFVSQLFSKFMQVERAAGPGYKGTGLGLAICKEIVERQGGRIWVETGDGRGAKFIFVLPSFRPTLSGRPGAGAR